MLDRMHTQDLRTIGAFLHSAIDYWRDGGVNAIAWTDNLLAELDRTAPEAEPEPRGSWYEEAVKQQCRANALDRLTDEQNDAMKALEAKLATERDEGRVEGYRSALNDKTNGELDAIMAPELAQARKEGENGARERFVALFLEWYGDPNEGLGGADFLSFIERKESAHD